MRISDWSSDVCSSDLANAGDYRRAIMGITLITGFSSTVTIPFITLAVELMGWRHALLVLAVIQLLGPALLYWPCLRDTVSGRQTLARQIGRAACRERVCQSV